VALGEAGRERDLPHAPVRLVVALALLVLHDAALLVQRGLVDRGQQVPHAVGLEPQRRVERGGRHVLEEVGAVLRRRAVLVGGADQLERAEEFVGMVLRGLEHQVLEQVREAGAAGFSFFEPTWYQRLTATIGALWSSCTTTVMPLSSLNVSNSMSSAPAARGGRGGEEREREARAERGDAVHGAVSRIGGKGRKITGSD
jgi:hypothetical protein